jgi:integrase
VDQHLQHDAAKYLAFWKWLTQHDLRREKRQEPPQVKRLRFAKRKAKTTVKRESMWTAEEHKVFLDYCEAPRLACFHAIAKDTGRRPSKLLQLKISDVEIKVSPSTGKKYAEFWICHEGKMKKARPASISDGIPYFTVWTAVHPSRDNPQGAYFSKVGRTKQNIAMYPLNLTRCVWHICLQHLSELLVEPLL